MFFEKKFKQLNNDDIVGIINFFHINEKRWVVEMLADRLNLSIVLQILPSIDKTYKRAKIITFRTWTVEELLQLIPFLEDFNIVEVLEKSLSPGLTKDRYGKMY
jgi:hypothetical protein